MSYLFNHAVKLSEEIEALRLANLRLRLDFSRAAAMNEKLNEENEALEKEVEQLRAELNDERNRFDKLSDFEVAESEDFREAKLYLRILLEYLQENGHDVEKLERIVALKRVLMKMEEENE